MSHYVEQDWITGEGLRAVVIVVIREQGDGTSRKSHRCGYVAVPTTFQLYGKGYMDLPEYPSVHGGLTFSSDGAADTYPAAGTNVHWFGFDCHHYMDGDIGPDPYWPRDYEAKSLEFCVAECESLATQLRKLELKMRRGEYAPKCLPSSEEQAVFAGKVVESVCDIDNDNDPCCSGLQIKFTDGSNIIIKADYGMCITYERK